MKQDKKKLKIFNNIITVPIDNWKVNNQIYGKMEVNLPTSIISTKEVREIVCLN